MNPMNIPLGIFAIDWMDVFMGWLGIGDGRWNPGGGGEDDGTGGGY